MDALDPCLRKVTDGNMDALDPFLRKATHGNIDSFEPCLREAFKNKNDETYGIFHMLVDPPPPSNIWKILS